MENITGVYEALIRSLEDSGYHLAGYSRELYHEMDADGPSTTELQVPIAK
jgi:effector-binding domain-containing protein